MRILLVDGKDKSLVKLTERLKQKQCLTAYFEDPLLAVKSLSKSQFDVIICANDIVKTSALNLLKAISIKCPTVVRIFFTAIEDKSIDKIAHYVFSSGEDPLNIIKTIRALESSQKRITKDVIVKAVAKVKTLPSPPKVYMQLNSILKNDNTDSDRIAEIISQDPALVAKILQFSNKSFMPNGKKLTNISEAITKMGVETLSCIVMTAELFSYQPEIPNFSLEEEQLHSLSTARFTASLVGSEFKHDALLVGLLHDIGKLVLFEIDKALTLRYFDNCARTSSDILLEKKIFATDHCQVGAYLLHMWSFPYHIIEAVLNHHTPKNLLASKFGIAQALYLSNCLLKEEEVNLKFIEHFKLENSIEKIQLKAERFK